MTRTILITGCSSGIGWHCALGLKARGWRVFATARKPEDIARLEAEGVEALLLDYADPASVTACAARGGKRTGGKLDALFNNGAYGQPGAVEDLTREVLEAQFAAQCLRLAPADARMPAADARQWPWPHRAVLLRAGPRGAQVARRLQCLEIRHRGAVGHAAAGTPRQPDLRLA